MDYPSSQDSRRRTLPSYARVVRNNNDDVRGVRNSINNNVNNHNDNNSNNDNGDNEDDEDGNTRARRVQCGIRIGPRGIRTVASSSDRWLRKTRRPKCIAVEYENLG